VWRTAGKFQGRSQVATWLLALARHKALEVARRRSTEPLDDDACEAIEDASDDPESGDTEETERRNSTQLPDKNCRPRIAKSSTSSTTMKIDQ